MQIKEDKISTTNHYPDHYPERGLLPETKLLMLVLFLLLVPILVFCFL